MFSYEDVAFSMSVAGDIQGIDRAPEEFRSVLVSLFRKMAKLSGSEAYNVEFLPMTSAGNAGFLRSFCSNSEEIWVVQLRVAPLAGSVVVHSMDRLSAIEYESKFATPECESWPVRTKDLHYPIELCGA